MRYIHDNGSVEGSAVFKRGDRVKHEDGTGIVIDTIAPGTAHICVKFDIGGHKRWCRESDLSFFTKEIK